MFRHFFMPIFLLFTFFNVSASEIGIKQICKDAYIKSFKVGAVYSGYPWGANLCYENQKVPEFLQEDFDYTVKQLKEINEKVASFLGMSPSKLFSEPINFEISGGALGATESYTIHTERIIGMGVFVDWRRGFDASIYTHELNHLLSGDKNTPLPDYYKKLNKYELFAETMSDWLAISVTGRIFTPVPELSECFNTIRTVYPGISYSDKESFYFQKAHDRYYMRACCAEVSDDPSDREKSFCKTLTSRGAFNALPVKDLRPFSLDKYPSHIESKSYYIVYDTHRLGIPLTSFFLDLQEQLGLDLHELFITTMKNLEKTDNVTEGYKCYFVAPNMAQFGTLNINYPNGSKLFKAFTSVLEKTYPTINMASMYDDYGLNKILEGASLEVSELALLQAREEYFYIMLEKMDELNPQEKECLYALENFDWTSPDHACNIKCEAK